MYHNLKIERMNQNEFKIIMQNELPTDTLSMQSMVLVLSNFHNFLMSFLMLLNVVEKRLMVCLHMFVKAIKRCKWILMTADIMQTMACELLITPVNYIVMTQHF